MSCGFFRDGGDRYLASASALNGSISLPNYEVAKDIISDRWLLTAECFLLLAAVVDR